MLNSLLEKELLFACTKENNIYYFVYENMLCYPFFLRVIINGYLLFTRIYYIFIFIWTFIISNNK